MQIIRWYTRPLSHSSMTPWLCDSMTAPVLILSPNEWDFWRKKWSEEFKDEMTYTMLCHSSRRERTGNHCFSAQHSHRIAVWDSFTTFIFNSRANEMKFESFRGSVANASRGPTLVTIRLISRWRVSLVSRLPTLGKHKPFLRKHIYSSVFVPVWHRLLFVLV